MPKYKVSFLQLFGAAGISDYAWGTTVEAESEEAALEIALSYADEMNRTTGMPPDGVKTDTESLRRSAIVQAI